VQHVEVSFLEEFPSLSSCPVLLLPRPFFWGSSRSGSSEELVIDGREWLELVGGAAQHVSSFLAEEEGQGSCLGLDVIFSVVYLVLGSVG
jgi:hypothetical protein